MLGMLITLVVFAFGTEPRIIAKTITENNKTWEQKAIKVGVGYYTADTAQFKFKGE